jgi:aminoglycoside 6'-N-acetyltransferase I
MQIQQLSKDNLQYLIELVLELWPEYIFDEEYEAYKNIIGSEDEICFLVKAHEIYNGFIHLTIRTDYVEGATELPVAYIEAFYVKPNYQRLGIGKLLLEAGENWARQKGCKQLASDTEGSNANAISFHQHTEFTEVNRVVCFIKKIC